MCRQNFYPFMHGGFRALNPDAHFFENWHNELIASKLQACFDKEITRLIINLPPRNLKSQPPQFVFRPLRSETSRARRSFARATASNLPINSRWIAER
jgi:hypothetical protein